MISEKNIDDIFLLSEVEWETIAAVVPNVPVEQSSWWWLRSPGNYANDTAGVHHDGNIFNSGFYVNVSYGCVRPAFHIPHLTSNGYKPGDKITVGAKTVCTVVFENVALADSIICKHRFDQGSNNWKTSEIKQFINSDEFRLLL